MAEELTPTESAALRFRQLEERMRRNPCDCENCEWINRILVGTAE